MFYQRRVSAVVLCYRQASDDDYDDNGGDGGGGDVGDDELVSSLLFDAEATRGVVSDWRKENSDAMLNRSSRKK